MSQIPRRFLSRLLNRPQLITPAAGAGVMAGIAPSLHLTGYMGPMEQEDRRDRSRDYDVGGAVAIVPVVGELVNRGDSMDAMSGLTSYAALRDMCADALGARDITGLILDIDSPGGEGAGCLDFATWLAAQRGDKPIWAVINQQACSAAYAIASAADRILIGEDAVAGSIGVVWYHTDISQALAKAGVTVTYVYKGDRKIDGAPELPLSDEAREQVDTLIGGMYDRFCSVVARNRGISEATVRATQAGIFRGQGAIAAGLADEIATLDEAVMNFSRHTAPLGASLLRAAAGARMAGTGRSKDTDVTPPAPKDDGVDGNGSGQTDEKQNAEEHEEQGTPTSVPLPATPATTPAQPHNPEGDVPAVNPPTSPLGAPPMEAQSLISLCSQAGHPELIALLSDRRATEPQAKAALASAKEILSIGDKMNMQGAARKAIAGGMTADAFRDVALAASANRDAAVRTDPRHTNGQTPATPALDSRAIFDRVNAAPPNGYRN